MSTGSRDSVSLLGEHGPDTAAVAAPGGPDALAFVVSRVAPHEFDERTLKDRFEDRKRLEGVARALVVSVDSASDPLGPFDRERT
ncbi:hypothetical protein [Streptomyces sp. NPDC001744]|uniref:hypothetical protein n=1 Tax=Streptomyces sp. NPDC001744 TaxID=3364606 RepID=UPI003699FBAE